MPSMQMYSNDKAIEFEALYNDIARDITRYRKIGINVRYEETRIKDIKAECDSKALELADQLDEQIINEAEEVYQNGIDELNKIAERLSKHELYYASYSDAAQIQSDIEQKDLSEIADPHYSTSTIQLLKTINSSDTRNYQSEKVVVEKIYKVAYEIIQMELVENGYSRVLEWVKTDSTATSFISSLIEKDIASLPASSIENAAIKIALNNTKAKGGKGSYLQEELILFLALYDEKKRDKIQSTLHDRAEDALTSKRKADRQNKKIDELKDKIDELTKLIKKSSIHKQVGIIISILVFLAAAKFGIDRSAKRIGHKEYRTFVEYYNSTGSTREFPEYMKKINGWNKTTLTAYGPWQQKNIFFGDYERKIAEYDLTGKDIVELEDALDLDFSKINQFSKTNSTEKRESIDPSELYSEAIVEIIRLTQDENDKIFVPNELFQQVYIIVLTTIAIFLVV